MVMNDILRYKELYEELINIKLKLKDAKSSYKSLINQLDDTILINDEKISNDLLETIDNDYNNILNELEFSVIPYIKKKIN
jgi:vacuolar-type H+-ATPase subunit D/Vma8